MSRVIISIGVTLLYVILLLSLQMFILRHLKNNQIYCGIQYIIFIFALIYHLYSDRLYIMVMVMVIVPIVLPIFLSRVLSWSSKDTIINKSVFLMIFTNGEIINIIIYFMLSPILEELFFREFLINHILNNNTFVIKVLLLHQFYLGYHI